VGPDGAILTSVTWKTGYSIAQNGRIDVRIKEATIEKVKRHIRYNTLLAEGLEPSPQSFPCGQIDSQTWAMILNLAVRLGFPIRLECHDGTFPVKFERKGWPTAFLSEARTESILDQFRELDRYIRYRLERAERKLGGAAGVENRFYSTARRFGLRSFVDAWNRMPRVCGATEEQSACGHQP